MFLNQGLKMSHPLPYNGSRLMNMETQYTNLLRLWVFRIFETRKARGRLISHRGYRDDDVAQFLGLGTRFDWEADVPKLHKLEEDFEGLRKEAETRYGSLQMPKMIRNNFAELSRLIRLRPDEAKILEFLAVLQAESIFFDCMTVLGPISHSEFLKVAARVLRLDRKLVAHTLSPKSHLIQSGMVHLKETHRFPNRLPVFFSQTVAESLLTEVFDRDKILREIVVPAPKATLCYADYSHVEHGLRILRPYLRKVLRSGQRGVNIFIHGIPGTGKSELTRVIAREMRCSLFELSSEDKDGDPVNPQQRLNALRMANCLLAKRSLLVFDEAEDVFHDGSLFQPSTAQVRKAWMNRMLETNRVPTIWISNTVRGLDPANVRRFDLVLELPNLPRKQRERTYRKICGNLVSRETVQRLACVDQLAPAVVARASKVITTLLDDLPSGDCDEAFQRLVDGTLKAQGSRKGLSQSSDVALPSVYDIQYLNCNTNLHQLGESVLSMQSCRICLHGPPGTGKTSFAQWLSSHIGRPLHAKRASDLLSPYVGMTEQNFAEVFALAQRDNAVLLIDEVDSFLQDRRKAVRSWEVTQVNEMLTQMEAFKGIFIASTNLMNNLDQAALRRFDLKLYFDYLQPDQAVRLLKEHCRSLELGVPSPVDLELTAQQTVLTPGDFANVARQHPILRFASPTAFVQAAIAECRLKASTVKGTLGFC